jgi:hypothetical protein
VVPNSPPVITSSNVTASPGQVIAASSLVTASDPDNDALVYYAFWDTTVGSGYFDVNGAVQDIGFVVSTPQLSQVHYHVGPSGSSDHIYASVFDGTVWATATQFDVSVLPNSPPVITSSNVTASLGQVFAASSLVSASDPDNDALVYYAFWDTTVGSGYFDVNGAVQDIGFVVSTPQLSQVHYHAGPSGSSDHIYASVFDGTIWATNTQFEVSVPSNTGFAVEADADASLVLAPVTGLQFCTVSTSGNDVMSGSDGSDTFVFHPNFGQDTITNFDLANDAIRFDSSIFQSVSAIAAHTYDSPVGAIIIDGQGDSVTLVGVTAAQFAAHQTDFHLL